MILVPVQIEEETMLLLVFSQAEKILGERKVIRLPLSPNFGLSNAARLLPQVSRSI